MERGPIFIGGCGRSGKTYMRLMLGSHPDIALTRRSNMWNLFYGRYGDLSQRDNFERCLEALLRYKHISYLEPDPERIRQEFWLGKPTYSHLFAIFLKQHAEKQGKSRWGDQSDSIERFADLIISAYPGAKIIHMIRDPRDRFEASSPRLSIKRGKVGVATARWLHSLRLAKRNIWKYPGHYKIVRYETMVARPKETLHDVCAFLDEDYFASMILLEREKRFRKYDSDDNQSGQSPLTVKFIGRYIETVSKQEIAFIQRYAGRDMMAFGYQLDTIRFFNAEKLRFALVDLPVNLASMQTWLFLHNAKGELRAQ